MSRFGWRPVIILALLVAAFSLRSPAFATASNAANILGQAAPLVLVTLGQTAVLFTAGFDISVGSVVALASVVAALGSRVDFSTGVALALAVGSLAGLVNGAAVAYLRVQPVVATLGMLIFARGAAIAVSGGGPVTGLPAGFARLAYHSLGPLPVSAWLALAAVAVFELVFLFVPMARNILAIGGSEQAARYNAIPVERTRLAAYVLCGAVTGLAAVLYTARANSGQPTLGVGLEVQSIAAAVIGGVALSGGEGRMWQAAFGALIVATLANGLNLAGISPFMQDVAMGLTLLGAVLLSVGRTAFGERGHHGRLQARLKGVKQPGVRSSGRATSR